MGRLVAKPSIVHQKNQWIHLIPRKGKYYRQRRWVEAGASLIPNRVDIDERPDCVNLKEEVGHFHGQDGYIVTLTERVSKLLLIARVKNKTKKAVIQTIKKMLRPYESLCKTITFDSCGEFADHASITRALGCKIYVAKPYHSWQRGFNENTNGLLRRFFPKGLKIGGLSKHKIYEVQLLINIHPRKA